MEKDIGKKVDWEAIADEITFWDKAKFNLDYLWSCIKLYYEEAKMFYIFSLGCLLTWSTLYFVMYLRFGR